MINNTLSLNTAFDSIKSLTPVNNFDFQPRVMTTGGFPTLTKAPPRDQSKINRQLRQVNQLQQKFSYMMSEKDDDLSMSSSAKNVQILDPLHSISNFTRAKFQDHFSHERVLSQYTERSVGAKTERSLIDSQANLRQQFEKTFESSLPDIKKSKNASRGLGLNPVFNRRGSVEKGTSKTPRQMQISTNYRSIIHQANLQKLTHQEIKQKVFKTAHKKKKERILQARTIKIEQASEIQQMSSDSDMSASFLQPAPSKRILTPQSGTEICITQNDYEPDEKDIKITGLDRNKYLFRKDDIEGMMGFLGQLAKARKKSNLIEQSIQRAAKECGLDLELAVKEIQGLVKKKISDDNSKNKCTIHKITEEFKKNRKSERPNFLSKEFGVCQHCLDRKDLIQGCIEDYKKLIDFKRKIHMRLQDQATDYQIIEYILGSIEKDKERDLAKSEFFKDKEQIKKLLDDPLLQIVEDQQQFNEEIQRQSGVAIIEKQKVPAGLEIYKTKQFQLISSQAKAILKNVSIHISEDNRERLKSPTIVQDAKLTEEEIKQMLAIQLLTSNVKKSGAGFKTRSTGFDMQDLIIQNRLRDLKAIENDTTGDVEQAKRDMQRIDLVNTQVMFRINYAKELLKKAVGQSYSFEVREPPVFEDEEQRKYEVGGYDEIISLAANEFLEKRVQQLEKIAKVSGELIQRKLVRLDTENSLSDQITQEDMGKVLQTRTLYHQIELQNDFFKTAKMEIKGNHLPPNPQSKFYISCQSQKVIANPVFKSIRNNELVLRNQKLSEEQCIALANLIKSNDEPSRHLLQVLIDGCGLKDKELAILMDAVTSTEYYETSLQTFVCQNNNEMGQACFKSLISLLDNPSPAQSLKKLELNNISVKNMKDSRVFFQEFTNLPKLSLQQLVLRKFNLNHSSLIGDLCSFIENNGQLRRLTLSDCNMTPKHLVQVIHSVQANFKIEHLNLSSNANSENTENNVGRRGLTNIVKDNNHLHKAEFVHFFGMFLKENTKIQSIDISGLLLGKVMLSLIPYLKENESLIDANLSNNLLSDHDIEYLLSNLEVTPPIMQERLQYYLQNDNCFSKVWDFFVKNHLNEHFGLNQKQATKNMLSRPPEKIYDSIINGGILKSCPKDLSKNILEQAIGSDLFKSNTLHLKKLSMVNKDTIFNQYGIEKFDKINLKHGQWENRDLSSFGDTSSKQSVVIVIDRDQGFTKITDPQLLSLIKSRYGFESHQHQYKENPIIFGSSTQWDAFQSLKLYQFALLLATKSPSERNVLFSSMFNESDFSLLEDFKSTSQTILPIFHNYCLSRNSLIVGKDIDDFSRITDLKGIGNLEEKDYFVYSMMLPVGKHSVFYFDPKNGQIYTRMVVVQPMRQELVPMATEVNQEKRREVRRDTRLMELEQEFLADIKVVDISQYFTIKSELQECLDQILQGYEIIQNLFYELLSESQETCPFVSNKDLKRFCTQTNLLPENQKGLEKFKMLDRSNFLCFLVWVFTALKQKSFKIFMSEKIVPLVKDSEYFRAKEEVSKNKEIEQFVEVNRWAIHSFLETHRVYHDLSMKYTREAILIKKVPISQYNCNKFYILSVKSSLSLDSFIELIFRISSYIYDSKSYQEEVPKGVEHMFEKTAFNKFREAMKLIVKEVKDEDDQSQMNIVPYLEQKVREQFLNRAKIFNN